MDVIDKLHLHDSHLTNYSLVCPSTMNERGRGWFPIFLRHEKEGDGADDDSDEDGHDGRGGGISSPQGQISRIEVIARATQTAFFTFCNLNGSRRRYSRGLRLAKNFAMKY